MRRLAIASTALLVLVIAGFGAGLWAISEMALRPGWYERRTPEQGLREVTFDGWQGIVTDPGHDFGYAFETVSFPARDGATLRGWWVPGAPGARAGVVTVHGGGADRRDFLRHLPVFHEAGYPVLAFDCREHGISDGRDLGVSFGVREHEDVIAAVAFARAHGGLERVAVVGTSQGGASVILAAAADPSIDAVVAENPFTDIPSLIRDGARNFDDRSVDAAWIVALAADLTAWRLGATRERAPIERIDRIAPRPLLLMHGTSDSLIPVAHTHALHARAPFAELWILEGAEHARLYNADPEGWRDRVRRFLQRSIDGPLSPRS